MFQKLYRHLEEMNDCLRQGKSHSVENSRLIAKISQQLESTNRAILSQNSLLASQQRLTESAHDHKKRDIAPILQIVTLSISCVGIVVIFFFSYYTFQLSRLARRIVNSPQAVERTAVFARSPLRSSAQIDSFGTNPPDMQRHLVKLDSLISEQTQSLQELKKLNVVSVRTFMHIRKYLDQVNKTAKENPLIADSLSESSGRNL